MAEEDLTTIAGTDPTKPRAGEATLMTRVREQWDQLGASLTTGQKTSIAIISGLVLLGLLALVGLAADTDWRPLFTRLDATDASAITAELDGAHVPYKLAADGTAILVPAAQVDEVRLRLAGQGLPKGGNVGFELFDSSDPWAGRREHEVRARRALEGELSRTIGRIEGVRAAKVHLALPEESLFVEQDRPPTASVMVDMLPARTLMQSQVDGIQRLVSAGVEGLEAGHVEIVDGRGELLSKPVDRDGKNEALDFKRKMERSLEAQALNILEPLVGKGRVQVRVNADVDFAKVEERIELLDDDKVVVAHETRTNEKRDALPPGPGGIPGARAPSPEGLQAVGGGLATERKQEDITYSIPKTTRTVQAPVGTLRRLSVAVIVDGQVAEQTEDEADAGTPGKYTPRTDEELARYASLVRKAVGFDERRGDQIEVVNERFAGELLTAGPPPMWVDLIRSVTPWLVALLIALLLVFVGVRPLVRFVTSPQAQELPLLTAEQAEQALVDGAARVAAAHVGEPGARAGGAQGLKVSGDVVDDELLAGLMAGGSDPSKVIREFARQEPGRTAQVLRRWLAKG